MFIVKLQGGLGNQLFQYALGRKLALRQNMELRLDLSEYQTGSDLRPAGLESFSRKMTLYRLRVDAPQASAADILQMADRYNNRGSVARMVRLLRRWIAPRFRFPATHIREASYRFDPSVLSCGEGAYLDGFWQSYRYFEDIADVLREEFRPKDQAIELYAEDYVERLRRQGGALVALHIRRGDLAHATEIIGDDSLVYGRPVSTDYIERAMACFPVHSQFLVFSDTAKDVDWCRRHVRGQKVHFSEGHEDIVDLNIMSRCDHNIIANSTFSWWAAWQNRRPGRRVIAPSRWSTPGSPNQMPLDDLIPAQWELI